MGDDYDVYEHAKQAEEAAEELVENFNGFEDLATAVDALAQEQIEIGNKIHNESEAKAKSGLADENERIAAITECDVRHEIGQALHGLLRSYGYQPRFSHGKDDDAWNPSSND